MPPVSGSLPRDFWPESSPVRRPPAVSTYSPSFTSSFDSVYGPAAIVTLSDAARERLTMQYWRAG